MAARPGIRLTVPGTLAYRNIAVRVVAEACRLVSSPDGSGGDPKSVSNDGTYDLRHPFDSAFVSAFAEIYNNIAIHAYKRRGGGQIELTITFDDSDAPTSMTVEIRDEGAAFDIAAVSSPDLDALPEGGMGIHIARALLDEVEYEPGPPNLWRLVKHLNAAEATATSRGT